MPRHVSDLQRDESFPVKPGTNEYEALSFLSRNSEFGFSPAEIAAQTPVPKSSASKTMARLVEKGVIERAEGVYYVEPERQAAIKRRVESLDAAARLFETAPSDDAYAEDWEAAVPTLDVDEEMGARDAAGSDDAATALVDEIAADSNAE